MTRLALLTALPLALALPASAQEAEPVTPASVVANASSEEWVEIAPEDLLVMELAPDADGEPRQVMIQLMPPPFSQPWVENIRTLARAHWWDGKSIYRVVDNWVAQWGGGDSELGMDSGPLPDGVESPEASYVIEHDARLWPSLGQPFVFMEANTPSPTLVYGRAVFRNLNPALYDMYYKGLPIAGRRGIHEANVWPAHCYASVGVARDLAPDTGTGSELYAVIGHAPRQLDRNIAVVGRVIEGIEHLSTLPRGTGDAGVYETREEDTPILSVRLGDELADPPRYEYLSTESESFARYVHSRANRQDNFYKVPAGGVDICNVQVPIRESDR